MKRFLEPQCTALAIAIFAWMVAIAGFVYGNYGSAASTSDPLQHLLSGALIIVFVYGLGTLPAATAFLISLWRMAHSPRTKTLYAAFILSALYFLPSAIALCN